MPGTETYINPAFPSTVGSRQTPPPGVRAEIFTYRATGNYYNWSVPPGVYYAKVTVVGGAGGADNPSTGGSTSFGTLITATGGTNSNSTSGCPPVTDCTSSQGSYSVQTGRNTELIGANYLATNRYIRNSYGFGTGVNGGSCSGGQGILYLENLVPGTIFRITIGAVGANGAATGNGVCLIEY